MASASSSNGGLNWLLRIVASLTVVGIAGIFTVLWQMSHDLSTVATNISAVNKRLDRHEDRIETLEHDHWRFMSDP